MKFLFIIAIVTACILLLGCKKDKEQTVSKPKNSHTGLALKFDFTEFIRTEGDISLKTDKKLMSISNRGIAADTSEVGEGFLNYFYIVYDSAGTEVSRIFRGYDSFGYDTKYLYGAPPSTVEIFRGEQSFGIIQDSLPAGDYTVIIIATNFFMNINSPEIDDNVSSIVYNNLSEAHVYRDTFALANGGYFKKFPISLREDMVNQTVVLDRIHGQLVLKILDRIPENANHYEIIINNEHHNFSINNETSSGSNEVRVGRNFYEEDKGGVNYQTTLDIFNTSEATEIDLRFYDVDSNLLASKNIPNIRFFKNKRTILTGNVFTSIAGKQFVIMVNDEWGDPNTVNF